MKTSTAPNPHQTLKEGDTPSWFHFLPNGLDDAGHPEWGGWGGRFVREPSGIYRDAADFLNGTRDARTTVWRWRPAFQNDFAARMDWCVKPYAEANHPPTLVVNGRRGRTAIQINAQPGDRVMLDTSGSADPDRGALFYKWWIYPELASPQTPSKLENDTTARAALVIAKEAQAGEVHVILEATDRGSPPLTSYRRIVVSVKP